jgi:hypothetical protein
MVDGRDWEINQRDEGCTLYVMPRAFSRNNIILARKRKRSRGIFHNAFHNQRFRLVTIPVVPVAMYDHQKQFFMLAIVSI